jgi:hypothetical protein
MYFAGTGLARGSSGTRILGCVFQDTWTCVRGQIRVLRIKNTKYAYFFKYVKFQMLQPSLDVSLDQEKTQAMSADAVSGTLLRCYDVTT